MVHFCTITCRTHRALCDCVLEGNKKNNNTHTLLLLTWRWQKYHWPPTVYKLFLFPTLSSVRFTQILTQWSRGWIYSHFCYSFQFGSDLNILLAIQTCGGHRQILDHPKIFLSLWASPTIACETVYFFFGDFIFSLSNYKVWSHCNVRRLLTICIIWR